ncbi:MAG: N-6 DNA methylase, partial [Pseudomonadota bacterium]
SGFHPEFSGRTNIHLNAALLGLTEKDIRESEESIIAFSELAEVIDRPVKTYSSGMYVRLAFSIATSVDPDVLIVDEALSVGDQRFAQKCVDRMVGFRNAGKTIIVCSHSMFLINELCDNTLWLKHGEISGSGKTSTVISEYLAYLEGPELTETTQQPSVAAPLGHVPEVLIDVVQFCDSNHHKSNYIKMSQPLTICVNTRCTAGDFMGHLAVSIEKSDGQMLFGLHLLSKMRPLVGGKGGGRIGVVHNGSPLFTGDAGSGESEIRRHILTHDYLDCIVAMPTDLFYNTNITTYLWFMSNRKPPERKGRVLLIDASGMSQLMKKNLGKKRREFTADCVSRIAQAYADFKNVDWSDAATRRALKAKVLERDHFFYRKVTIERPLRMRFQATPGRVESVRCVAAVSKMPLDQSQLLNATLAALDAEAVYLDADSLRAALQATAAHLVGTLPALVGIKPKLSAKALELARKGLGSKDKTAEPCTNEKGEVLSDSDLRDAEYVPLRENIDRYFAREVLPHWPDAWVNTEVTDERDGLTGVVGTEINFNREFYVYKPPRSRLEIQSEIEAMEKRFMDMLHG